MKNYKCSTKNIAVEQLHVTYLDLCISHIELGLFLEKSISVNLTKNFMTLHSFL